MQKVGMVSASATHFYDIFNAKMYMEGGEVLHVGSPEDFVPGNEELQVKVMLRDLRDKGIINEGDEIMWSVN